jgi:hypothetical protein
MDADSMKSRNVMSSIFQKMVKNETIRNEKLTPTLKPTTESKLASTMTMRCVKRTVKTHWKQHTKNQIEFKERMFQTTCM